VRSRYEVKPILAQSDKQAVEGLDFPLDPETQAAGRLGRQIDLEANQVLPFVVIEGGDSASTAILRTPTFLTSSSVRQLTIVGCRLA